MPTKFYYCESDFEHAVIEAYNLKQAKKIFLSIINSWLEDYAKLEINDIKAEAVNVYFKEKVTK